jgi:spore maturation protein CgeB
VRVSRKEPSKPIRENTLMKMAKKKRGLKFLYLDVHDLADDKSTEDDQCSATIEELLS